MAPPNAPRSTSAEVLVRVFLPVVVVVVDRFLPFRIGIVVGHLRGPFAGHPPAASRVNVNVMVLADLRRVEADNPLPLSMMSYEDAGCRKCSVVVLAEIETKADSVTAAY